MILHLPHANQDQTSVAFSTRANLRSDDHDVAARQHRNFRPPVRAVNRRAYGGVGDAVKSVQLVDDGAERLRNG